LYLKGLKNQDSFKYNNELKKTAAYTTDRTVLFDFITSKKFNIQKEGVRQQTREVKAPEIIKREEEKLAESNLKPITKVKDKLEIGKPISFTNSENHSFNQWLQLSTKKPIIRKEISKKGSLKKVDLIEKFIQSNPKIGTIPKDKSVSISVSKNKQDSSLMTETLAKVYLEQKKYENAIQAYRILSLKYPEKSGFFADQIKRIQILQKNKP
jgi:putative cell wall-binding protein